ncbi:MAG: hypothetical protein HY298_16960 [Verrucomicrobia bacterium]|nr:hypothetical protein [Verrucomicrobiota bacterium]
MIGRDESNIYATNANSELTQFTYNAAGDRLTLTDGKNQTTTWTYLNSTRQP